jgi:hypothetical protein
MKNLPVDLIKTFFRDRTMVFLTMGAVLVCVVYGIYTALALEPSDLQVATRYTAFGDTHFYRTKWYYLLFFILFGIIVTMIHTAIAIKLYGRQQRQLAIALLSLTFLILVIGWILTRSVLEIAFL